MVRCRLYVDESGDHGYGDLDSIGGRFLALSGLVIENDTYRTDFRPELERFKQDVIPHDPDFPLVLHRRDIIDRTGPFKILQSGEKRRDFDDRFLRFISTQQFIIITVVPDKKEHIETYGKAAFHPYHYCLAALMERYCGLLHFGNRTGDVLAESRGRKEDDELKRAYRRLLQEGTQWRSGSFFGAVLTSSELRTAKKEAGIAGLQVADLLTANSKMDVLAEFGRIPPQVGEFRERLQGAMRRRYNRQVYSGRIKGYGMVLL